MKEFEMFPAVKALFEEAGYSVNAEVKNCDVTAVRGDDLIIVEMKTTLNIKLLAQGINRQRTGADVYIAVPRPKGYDSRKWRDIVAVIKKLELGLIFVTVSDKFTFAEIVTDPVPFKPSNTYKVKKRALMDEITSRRCDVNTGGVTGRKIVTAYIEAAVHIGCIMEHCASVSPKDFKVFGIEPARAGNILRNNVFGWFCKIDKGVYTLSDKWSGAKAMYKEVYEYYARLAENETENKLSFTLDKEMQNGYFE